MPAKEASRTPEEEQEVRRNCEQMLIQDCVFLLYGDHTFYGHMFTSCRKHVVTGQSSVMGRIIDTCAVYITTQTMNLVINADYYAQFERPQRLALLEHELLHIALYHCSRQQRYKESLNRWSSLRWNAAVDLVVNSYIKNLPPGALQPEMYNLEPKKTSEYYYNNLPDNALEQLISMIDDHSLWDEGDESQVNRDLKNATVASAVENARKSAGSLPGDLESLLDKINGAPKIPWNQILRRFIIGTGQRQLNYTKKRVSKRYGTRPGIQLKPLSNIGIFVDVSGSVSDKELQAFFREIDSMHRMQYCDLVLAEFDADVKESSFQSPYRSGEKIEVHGRGGTMYCPIFDFIIDKKLDLDSIVVLTDGHNFDKEDLTKRQPLLPTLWVVSKGGNLVHPFGEVVELEVD